MFFSSSTRRKIESLFDNVHDTFGRTVTAYKDAEKVVTIRTPQYNAVYGNAGRFPLSISKTTVSRNLTVRIRYIRNSEDYFKDSNMDSQFKISIPKSVVRIKVDADGKDFLSDAKRVDLDGNRYRLLNDSNPKPIKPYTPKYFAFFLAPIDE